MKPNLSAWGWQADGSCRGMDSSVFFSPPHERGRQRRARESRAVAVCQGCPVKEVCAEFAVDTRQPFGVWGGMTESDRLRTPAPSADTARSAPAGPPPTPPGTPPPASVRT